MQLSPEMKNHLKMTKEEMTEEEKLDAIGRDISEMTAYIISTYKGYEWQYAQMMTRSLGAIIAIATRNPRAALDEAAQMLKKTKWGEIRAAHFGYKLGVKEPEIKLVDSIQIGDPAALRKPD